MLQVSLMSKIWPQSTQSNLAAAIQAVEMLAGVRAGGIPEGTVSCPMLRLVRGDPEEWAVAHWRLSHCSSSQPYRTHAQLLDPQEEGDEGPSEEVMWPWSPFSSPQSGSLFRGLHLSFLEPLS